MRRAVGKGAARPVVLRSVNDATGLRCVDILRWGDGFGWRECRRDPEDGSGWRPLGEAIGGFHTEAAAAAHARGAVGWMGGMS